MSQPSNPNQPSHPNEPSDWRGVGRPVPDAAGNPEPGLAPRDDARPAWDDATIVSSTPPQAPSGGPNPAGSPPTWAPSFYAAPPTAAAEPDHHVLEPEPAAMPVTTEPVRNRSSATRWAVALGATALIVVVGLAVLLFARQGTTSTAAAPGYLPADTVAYGEFRLDLPGDQRENLGEFLSHFPGFADSSTLEQKLDDVFDRIFAASGTEYRYTTDVKPWFGGQVSFGLGAPDEGEATAAPPIAIVTVRDRAAAQDVLDRLRADASDAGEGWVSQEYAGTTIWSAQLDGGDVGVDGFHYALTDDALLLGGNLADVQAALDRRRSGGDSLGTSDEFNGALTGLREDRLATIWMNTSFIKERALEQLEESGATMGTETIRSFLEKMPNRVVSELYFEPDRLVGEVRTDTPGGAPDAKTSELADNAPSDALVYLEWRDVGSGLGDLIRQLKSDPAVQEAAPQLTQVEAFLGGSLESFVDWMGDVALVGSADGDAPSVALLATARDEGAGQQRLAQLAALLQFAGQFGVQVSSDDIDGTTITTITLPGNIGSMVGAPVPTDVVPEDVTISYGFRNGTFALTSSAQEAARLLNLPADESLAESDRFRAALDAAGGEDNAGVTWVDVAGIRGVAEGLLPDDQRQMYEREIRPYLEPLDVLVGVALRDGDDLVQRTILTVK